jgi:NADP-dependent 3-hydroxy acid dehydrogenase YdfG
MTRYAIVIGHSSGLGSAITTMMLQRGDRVAGFARRDLKMQSSALVQHHVDLSDQDDLDTVVTAVEREHQNFDAVILTAGALAAHQPGKAKLRDVEYVFAVNALAPIYLMDRLLARIEANGADVVIVSSSSVAEYYPKLGAYSASKAALIKMTDDLRVRLRESSARVIELCPSGFTSNLYATMRGEKVNRDESAQIDVDDLARLVLFALDLPKRVEVGRLIINRK